MDSKKMAVISAAVLTYIRTGEEAALAAAAQLPADAASSRMNGPMPSAVNAWGMAGRSDQMQGRFLMQKRIFK